MQQLNQHTILKWQNYLLYAIGFFIPVWPRFNSILIAVFTLLGIYSFAKGWVRAKLNEVSVVLIAIYVLEIIGMLYSENIDRGLFDLQVKLSLIVLPLGSLGFKFENQKSYENALKAYLTGVLLASVFCLLQSTYKVVFLGAGYWHFLTSRFSVIVHQSYFAMYLIFALLIHAKLEWPIMKKSDKKRSFINLSIFLFLSICVVLTGSKTGFVMWFLIVLGMMVALIRTLKAKWIPVLSAVVVLSLIGAIYQNAPLLQERIGNMVKVAKSDSVSPESTESTAVRSLVYSAAWEVVTEQGWFGQGTGDFQDKLDEVYKARGYSHAAELHLNAHNLFLQSWITIGIPGLLLISGLFILMFYMAIKNRAYIYLGFTLLFLLISLTESALNVQAGVIFFVYFLVIFSKKIQHAS